MRVMAVAAVVVCSQVPLALGAQDGEETPVVSKDLPLGHLSDPDIAPKSLNEALTGGRVRLNNRIRLELADVDGTDTATALTNRIRLGYETKTINGFTGYIEMENVTALTRDEFFVPATGQGDSSKAVVADPDGTEINRVWVLYKGKDVGGTGLWYDFKAGRQRIIFDDSRFVGNVGWRQFEQTFDALRLTSNLGLEDVEVTYAYLFGVQRIFGPDGPNFDSDSHLIHVSYDAAPELKVTPFVYLLDFDGDSPANDSDTWGIRTTGTLVEADGEDDVSVAYEATYARQTDSGSNPNNYEADFVAAQVKVAQKGLGAVTAGYQLLGSDNGTFAFQTPLGTNHKFQGFADRFLVTPNSGLQDFYLTVSGDLPWDIKGAVTYHYFQEDDGGDDLGYEIDFVASKKLDERWSVLAKGAFFDGHSGQPDTSKFWLQLTFAF
ncbi:MAG: alginate export family protein [Planctomycetota bacterium]